ncbi:hypothetical protein AB0910_24260 [Streptomyces sp. NPDC047002]|uniref:hypothetical protein n=1 Tax=Streptomyces sp. NPDC047002 TaxID=3155475 RepID=UPI003451B228
MRATARRNAPRAEALDGDPSRDGSEVVSAVYDRGRAEFVRRIGIEGLLTEGASL